jgi:hypothetical protein
MYRKEDKDRPLEHRMADGSSGFPPEFRNCAYRLADRLIKEIEIDWKKSENIANEPPDGIGNVTQATWVPASSMHKKLRVAIGPHTDSFELSGKDQPLTLLRQALEAAGAEVVSLDSKKLLTYNPTDGRPLRPELRNADVLLVPVLEEQPLRPDIPGGHTSILTSEWAELKKPQKSLVWYRPPPEDVCPGELADPPHLEAFKKLAPICSSPQAVVNLLFGAGASDVIRIYIENDDAVPMYSLGDVLENAWAEFRKVAGEKLPNLKYEPVRLNQLDELLDDVPRDVAAIVLLHIKGHTPERSLRTREQIVENSFPKSGHFYPGLVALVFSPPKPTLDPKPNHSWGDVTLYRTENDVDLELDVSSQVLLKQFLRKMWQQYQKA